jgi:rod shape-determining protein MreD
MSARRYGPTVELLAVFALGIAAIHLALVPFDFTAGRAPGPDLVFCLVLAWTIRRPNEARLWAILALGLASDVLLSRPIGLGALALLFAAEAARSSAPAIQSGSFLAEWATAAGLFAAVALAQQAALNLVFLDGPGLWPLAGQVAATAAAYPLVVFVLAAGFGMRAPRRVREDRLGRIA